MFSPSAPSPVSTIYVMLLTYHAIDLQVALLLVVAFNVEINCMDSLGKIVCNVKMIIFVIGCCDLQFVSNFTVFDQPII